MKTNIQTIRALLVVALIVVAVGCSEFNAPTASQPPESSGENFQYPPIDNVIANVEAAGYKVVSPRVHVELDDQECDTVTVSRFCRRSNESNINLSGIVKLTVPGSALPNDMTITVVAPSECMGIADFYPHPTQFNGNVQIRWDTRDFDLPEGMDFDDIVPLYVHDDGTIEEVSFVRSENRFITVSTNHFSRYIITGRVGA